MKSLDTPVLAEGIPGLSSSTYGGKGDDTGAE